jgi:glucose/arabinose dehydrogenase
VASTTDTTGSGGEASSSDGGSTDGSGGQASTTVSTTTASGGSAGVSGSCDPSAAPLVGGLGLRTVISSSELELMNYAVQAPGSDDWYLVQQGGVVRVLSNGALLSTPFYDVSSEMDIDPSYDERGLHAIAFPPDYQDSGLFYVVMTPTTGDRANRDLLLEHQRSDADPLQADMTVTRTLIDLEGISPNNLFANIHNSYTAKFGPDGMLYVGMGDGGGSCNDNTGFVGAPQDIASPYGKILRFDMTQPAPYGAADNPFVSEGDGRVLHYGLRNPFRFSWDADGNLFIGDVGQDTHEEIDVAPSGAVGLNFGWGSEEGDESTCSGLELRSGSEVTAPIFFTTHGGGSGIRVECDTSPFCDYGAIVGGAVYQGSGLPSLRGTYLFGDWSANNMAALYHCDGQTSDVTVIDLVVDPNQPNNGYLLPESDVPAISSLTAIVEDHEHELYLVLNGDTLAQIVPVE